MKLGVMALGAAFLLSTHVGPSWAFGGSFVCKDSPTKEAIAHVDGSSTLQSIVIQYMDRWDARDATRQCQAYASGQPYDISCQNGRRDWPAILASVPKDYFGRSDSSLAASYSAERRKGTGFKEAMAYCRSVGAIK